MVLRFYIFEGNLFHTPTVVSKILIYEVEVDSATYIFIYLVED